MCTATPSDFQYQRANRSLMTFHPETKYAVSKWPVGVVAPPTAGFGRIAPRTFSEFKVIVPSIISMTIFITLHAKCIQYKFVTGPVLCFLTTLTVALISSSYRLSRTSYRVFNATLLATKHLLSFLTIEDSQRHRRPHTYELSLVCVDKSNRKFDERTSHDTWQCRLDINTASVVWFITTTTTTTTTSRPTTTSTTTTTTTWRRQLPVLN